MLGGTRTVGEAFMHFRTLYDQAVQFEIQNKDNALPPGMRVLDKKKLLRWLERVKPHIPAELTNLDNGPASEVLRRRT